MAYLIAAADGNFTAASTWKVCNGTLFVDSEAGTLVVGATWIGPASGQTPGAITIDGMAVKINAIAASPTGTFSVRLYNITDAGAAAGTTVTINVSDLPTPVDTKSVGWVFFAFAAPVTLIAAKSYRPEAICSVANEVTLWRDGTGNNLARLVRTTTTQAPSAGDAWYILGEWTGVSAQTTRTVTMDSTATTDYGNGAEVVGNPEQFGIGHGGTLTWGTTAATNYRLRLSGSLVLWQGGTMTMGTVATPVPRDSTAELQFDVTTTAESFVLRVYGTFIAQGLSRTAGKEVWNCNLNATTLAAATTWNVDTDTGWLNGDVVAIMGTRGVSKQTERLVLNGNAGASSFVTTAAAAYTHDGTGNLVAEVVLLTRNVVVTNVSAVKTAGGVSVFSGGTVDCDWVWFQRMGSTTSTASRNYFGVDGTGVASYEYCFLGDNSMNVAISPAHMLLGSNFVAPGAVTLRHCGLGVSEGSSGTAYCLYLSNNGNASVGGLDVEDVALIGGDRVGSATTRGLALVQLYGSFVNVRGWQLNSGLVYYSGTTLRATTHQSTLFSNIQAYSCAGSTGAVYVASQEPLVIDGLHAKRCSCGVLQLAQVCVDLTINGGTWIGNASQNITTSQGSDLVLRNVTAKCETSFTTQYFSTLYQMRLYRLENCEIGGVGANENFTTAVFYLAQHAQRVNCEFVNTVFHPTMWSWVAYASLARLAYQRAGGVSGTHYVHWPDRGYVRYETTVFRTAAPSERLQLGGEVYSVATSKYPLKSSARRVGVRAGYRAEVSVWVRKDGSYAGEAPRLCYTANAAIGLDAVGTLDTLSVGADEWEQLTGIVPSAVAEEDGVVTVWVEADGAAGNVYVDDWTTVEA